MRHIISAICLVSLLPIYSLMGGEAIGIILPFKEVIVSASTENTVQNLEVEIGSEVKKGAVLARLDSRIHDLQVKRFERVLTLSTTTYESTSQLVKDDIISKEEALKAEIERDLAQTQLEVAKVELSLQTITAPMDGIIVEALKEEGETVKKAEEMFVLINIDQVFLQLFLSAEEAYSIKKDQVVDIHFPVMPGKNTYKGKVYFIDPRIDATSGLLRTRILIENPDHEIRAGMRGEVVIP